MAATEGTAAQTLSMLAERLQRIDYVVNGDQHDGSENGSPNNASASARLRNLERTLKALAARSHAVSDIFQLQKHYPELFHPTESHAVPSSLAPASLAQLILAHESLYKTSSVQLSTLNDNSTIPESAPLVKLIAMQSRIDKLETKQMEQAHEFAELRARSARAVEKYYESGVLQMGEQWTEWEERLKDCEILVRRKEAAKRREEGAT
ncbi:hypothetical protein HII31_09816 [Pseudocercospora fuligena]|uniref:Nuclear distribution protein RO10 n=1 Tax=Pseudocercospora fuligena TaxID=685502 RepID=A0A8H6VE22_9PEZI|nr:hypothetical protein HII31_09816 [Pseudocercospora fuligena]